MIMFYVKLIYYYAQSTWGGPNHQPSMQKKKNIAYSDLTGSPYLKMLDIVFLIENVDRNCILVKTFVCFIREIENRSYL